MANLGYNARQPAASAVNQALANWLVANHLTSGLGGYWDANITALASGGAVRIAPVARSRGVLDQTAGPVRELGASALVVPADVSDPGSPPLTSKET